MMGVAVEMGKQQSGLMGFVKEIGRSRATIHFDAYGFFLLLRSTRGCLFVIG